MNQEHDALVREARAAKAHCDHTRRTCEEVGCDYALIRRLADALEARLQVPRYDLVVGYDDGGVRDAQMEPSQDGLWVRFDPAGT